MYTVLLFVIQKNRKHKFPEVEHNEQQNIYLLYCLEQGF